MATSRRCANNHVYDADLYASCPYCSGRSTSIQFGAVPVPEAGRTTAPGMMCAGKTVAPGMHRNPEELSKTVAPGMYPKPEAKEEPRQPEKESRTIGLFQQQMDLEPVVGWLACIEGPDKGKSFQLFARINFIGRGSGIDISLDDMTVSKDQVKLGYDTKHNNFCLIPGGSTNISYLNDNPLYIPTMLSAFDLIELGQTKLVFVPLCGEKFRWDSGLQRGE